MATELYKSSLFTRSLAKTNSDYSALDNCGSKKTSNSASIFINNSSSCDDTSSSGTTALEKFATVTGIASTCLALGTAGATLHNTLSPNKDNTTTPNNSSTVTSAGIDTALNNAQASGNWKPVELLINQSDSAIQTKQQEQTQIETQKTNLNNQKTEYQKTVGSFDTDTKTITDDESAQIATESESYKTEDTKIDEQIKNAESSNKDGSNTATIATLKTKKAALKTKHDTKVAEIKKTTQEKCYQLKMKYDAAKTSLADADTQIKALDAKKVANATEITNLKASKAKAQLQMNAAKQASTTSGKKS